MVNLSDILLGELLTVLLGESLPYFYWMNLSDCPTRWISQTVLIDELLRLSYWVNLFPVCIG